MEVGPDGDDKFLIRLKFLSGLETKRNTTGPSEVSDRWDKSS